MILYQEALIAKILLFSGFLYLKVNKTTEKLYKFVYSSTFSFSNGITTDWFECVTGDKATIYRQPYSLSSPSIWLRRSIADRPKESQWKRQAVCFVLMTLYLLQK